ncbi:TetR/AcrR family transcriptional regulator [Clostridium sp. BJN0013]|uniref:TetR/AcrR family transcriptional regulator n=1 Tax=Clostridium sp. BJN0013 TaxID=3236840 RepID=UPI0034C626BE
MDNRLMAIDNIATELFINHGYSRTKVSYIAKKTGISVGAIYNLFENKQAILKFIIKNSIDPNHINSISRLPIKESDFNNLETDVKLFFEKNKSNFESNIHNDTYSFEEMLSDIFDFVNRYGRIFLIYENNRDICNNLFLIYINGRNSFFNSIFSYIQLLEKNKKIRTLKYPEYDTRLIIETVAWWLTYGHIYGYNKLIF